MPKIKIGFSTVLLALLLLFYTGFYSTFILLFCIVCHEMGHVFAARALKVKLRSIRCNLFGARIELELPLSSYMSEFVIALSGPAVNIIMGCVGIILEGRNADFFQSAKIRAAEQQCSVFPQAHKFGLVKIFRR